MKQIKNFDEQWNDEVFDIAAINIPLLFPDETLRNDKIWIKKRVVVDDIIFDKEYKYDESHIETAILKPSIQEKLYTLKDGHGNIIEDTSDIFPAKAWMSDNGQERCMMFAAAKEAKGDVLVAGLGLAIYPQFVLLLNCPIQSITIIENNQEVIDLVKMNWIKNEYKIVSKLQ